MGRPGRSSGSPGCCSGIAPWHRLPRLARPGLPDGHPHRAAPPEPLRRRAAPTRRRPRPAPPAVTSAATSRSGASRRPTPEEILEPNPREVSSRLLARRGPMREVPFLNLLAAAWLQFMVHDWMSHGPGAPGEEIRVPLAEDDDFAARSPGDEMLIRRSRPAALADGRRAAGVRQHRDRLVGRLAGLRQHARARGPAARGPRRAPEDGRRRAAARGGAQGRRPDGRQRQLVGRPRR